MRVRFIGTILLLLASYVAAEAEYWLSKRGLYKVSYTSSIEPVEINRMHEWIVHIETADGAAVEDAELIIDGGMPAHDHGLPTRPRVTAYLGDGDYRVQGIRFHMAGEWQITLELQAGATTDTVIILVML